MKHPILYVDDEQPNLDSFRLALGSQFKIHLANSPSEAIEILSSNEIKVVVSDQRMPEMSGLELISKIREINPDIVCIILTAFTDIDVTVQAINQGGVYRFILKPWDMEEMQIALKNAIEKYELQSKNKALVKELSQKNQELQSNNEELVSTAKALREKEESLRKQNAEFLDAKEKAEESDSLKSAFLQNISHEIRTPLNGILGFSELLKDAAGNNETLLSYIDTITDSGNQLLRIVDDILDISRIETGQLEIDEELTAIDSIIDDAYKTYSESAQRKGILFEKPEVDKNINELVYVDRTKLTQILHSIIGNAIKFTHKGKISLSCRKDGNVVVFAVTDTGIGISEQNLSLIFDRFRQAESSFTRNYGGTGLGLTISKGYIELIGGRIWVESELGKGSTFYFSIPFKPQSAGVQAKQDNGDAFKEAVMQKVLVVDDEDINSQYLREILMMNQLEVFFASNGEEAVTFAKENKELALILMDIKMPIMDGYEATRKIKEINPVVPVVAQTAYATTEDKEKAFAAGCDDFMSKPYKLEVVNEIIKKYLS